MKVLGDLAAPARRLLGPPWSLPCWAVSTGLGQHSRAGARCGNEAGLVPLTRRECQAPAGLWWTSSRKPPPFPPHLPALLRVGTAGVNSLAATEP